MSKLYEIDLPIKVQNEPTLLSPRAKLYSEVDEERFRQYEKWGIQHHLHGTGSIEQGFLADFYRNITNAAAEYDELTWAHILQEEFAEALAESDEAKLREELVQVIAVAVAWIEDIDGQS